MNQQRRMFRGRGGPNDRRLPKHNARRRRPHPNFEDDGPNPPKYSGPAPTHKKPGGIGEQDEAISMHGPSEEERNDMGEGQSIQDDSNFDKAQPNPCREEIRHLHRRIRNVQESIQTSTALVNPSVYQEICLNAVANCVNEWRSIVRHYRSKEVEDGATAKDSEVLTPEVRKETGLEVFQLIQLSLQAGPLAGAKPGYFKRCGGEIAKMVGMYLDEIVPKHEDLAQNMGFSAKQMDTMIQWQDNATKAALNEKPPSKSVLKLQQQQQRVQKKGKKE
ncbi:hypothetical protein IV203_034802 [Nitzschia inconspicua]|uniref:Uncharacterized protein n=1 Tax=Nitzschia inconspicua TaxID=303405 RepID=A0A9K3LCD6_9STRA|nr:hypothetical protein IV203_034802 [Nitzschia inconspicua]